MGLLSGRRDWAVLWPPLIYILCFRKCVYLVFSYLVLVLIFFLCTSTPGHDLGCGRAVRARTTHLTKADTGEPIGAPRGQNPANPDIRLGSCGGVGLKTSGLEPAQHLGVGPFLLTVAPGV